MDEKINLRALEDYSDDYASKVTASFFTTKEKITGPEILKICEVHQVNLFVIRELLHAWKLESQKIRSPFFDYSATAVADAMTKFQNALSNNISISKENFQPLLKKAVTQALYLLLDPYDFYSDTLDNGSGGSLKVEDLRNDIKYVKINRTPLEKLLQALEEKKMTSISGNEAFALLDRILEEVSFTPEDIEGYIGKFSKILPLEVETFYGVKANVPEKPAPVAVRPPPKENVRRPVAAQPTVHDQLPKTGSSTLAEDFQKRKKIKDSLTINQKFMFTKILFKGDFEQFSSAIEKLDELDNLPEANSYLQNNHADWNKESEEYQEFMEMVEKRFG